MSAYVERVAVAHRSLGIAPDYADRTGLPLIPEATELVVVSPGPDRPERRLTPEAAARWARLEAAAERDGVRLILISAFRTVEYQRKLIERKLARGADLADVLKVIAAPGYSEHHGGHAVDIGTPGCEPLTEAFEQTPAFAWLHRNAHDLGFRMSYPRDNPHGLVYEPWHWTVVNG